MLQKLHDTNRKTLGIIAIAVFSLLMLSSPLQAQELPQKEQLKPLKSDVGIVGFTADLHWYNYASTGNNTYSATKLELEFRNVRLMSSHVGIGFKLFGSISMNGFFEGVSYGESGIGPVLRYYPLESKRWQPYFQADALLGYKLTLAGAPEYANNDNGIRYRTSLQAGFTYRVSNAFGIFFEVGPAWDYGGGFDLDTRAVQANIGIELFRFN